MKMKKRKKRRTRKSPIFALLGICATLILLVNLWFHYKAMRRKRRKKRAADDFARLLGRQFSMDDKENRTLREKYKPLIVHHTIKNVSFGFLTDLGRDMALADLTLEEASKGKEELIQLLKDTGIETLDAKTIQLLPTWKEIVDLYGDGPVILGEEQSCERFQKTVPRSQASVAPAGSFNTGTNILASLLDANCVLPQNPKGGVIWQVPWVGKKKKR